MARRPDVAGEPMTYAAAAILMDRGARKATAFTRSRTLKRNGIYGQIVSSGRRRTVSEVHTPYYWAKYLHNGRGGFRMKERKLAWFKNFNDDPRYSGKRPVHFSDLKKLTPAQYSAATRRNQMVFRTQVGPTATSKLDPFFSNTGGMAGLAREGGSEILEEANARVRERLARLPKSINRTVRV